MQVVVNKLITRYELTGKGKTVLLLHGWGDTLAGFHDLTAALSEKHQVVVLDLPGFGQTQAPAEAWDLLDYAKFVRDFLKKTKIKPSVIVGHSNGGAIALKGLGNGVLTADKLVLLASSGIRGEYKGRVKAARLITKTGKALSRPLPSTMRFRLRRKVYDTIGSDMLVAENLQESFKKIVADDVRPDAAKVKIPALLLYGDKDTATPLSYGKMLADEMPKAILDDISPAGHFVHHDQPEMVLNRIREFLK
ncbi:MAG: alpha/beta hydrolase [Candidatus Saccharibacteria bacterium]|nr:alpha/beta hydrolase [Candidatus Saccharibacteria bacterium]